MQQIPSFRPGQKGPIEATLLVEAAIKVRDCDYLPAQNALQWGRNAICRKSAIGRETLLGILGNMKNRYRRDEASLRAIHSIPSDDESPEAVKLQMQQMSALWGKLPVPAGSPLEAMSYLPWQGMNRAVFDSLRLDLISAQAALPVLERQFEEAETQLAEQEGILAEFVHGSGEIGLLQFAEHTGERVLIEEIPKRPSTHTPGVGAIALHALQADYRAVLTYDAPHATSFILRHKSSGNPVFTTRREGLIERTFITEPLPSGDHEFDIIGHNSLGDGDPSVPVKLTA
ncbi:MAG: hypothetical protein V4710_06200 [Verrucomicrobiota bacterium]